MVIATRTPRTPAQQQQQQRPDPSLAPAPYIPGGGNLRPIAQQAQMLSVPIGAVVMEWEKYYNFPSYQRDGNAWKPLKQRLFIDSLLRHYITPPLIASRLYTDEGERYSFSDGKQRLSAVRAFGRGELRLLTEREMRALEPEGGLEPIMPGCTWERIGKHWQAAFTSYTLALLVTSSDIEEHHMRRQFRRIQQGVPLTRGEDYWTYQSRMVLFAEEIKHHPFWKTVYVREEKRKDHLEAAIMLAMLALHSVDRVKKELLYREIGHVIGTYAAGRYDDLLTEEARFSVEYLLAGMAHVFVGANATSRMDIIPMTQAALLCEMAGVELLASRQGCLAAWFGRTKHGTLRGATWGNLNIFAQMAHLNVQRDFWVEQTAALLGQPGLVRH